MIRKYSKLCWGGAYKEKLLDIYERDVAPERRDAITFEAWQHDVLNLPDPEAYLASYTDVPVKTWDKLYHEESQPWDLDSNFRNVPETTGKKASRTIVVFRGENVSSENKGKGGIGYWSPDIEYAAQFTQTGQLKEVLRRKLSLDKIYDAEAEGGKLPSATNESEFDAAMQIAAERGFYGFKVKEGSGEPDSYYVFDRRALSRPFSWALVSEEAWKYFQKRPELPYQEDILRYPEYHAQKKNVKAEIVWMSPQQYFVEIAANRQPPMEVWQEKRFVERDLVEKYYERALAGGKMPLPSIDKITGDQEGRHRAVVAEKLGLAEMPVLVVDYFKKL